VPTSAQYGLDNLYASDKLFATSDVIDKAADTWVLGSGESRCTSEFNNELKFRLRNETDFMKSIFPGGDRQGKTQRSRRPRKRCVENHRNAALRNNDRTEDQVG